MKHPACLSLVLLLVSCAACPARAEPAWGGNCLSCHGEVQTGLITAYGEDTTADPDESATGAPDRGPLPVFQSTPDETRTLLAELTGLDIGDTYAVVVQRFRFPGVEGGGELLYTGDCAWPEWGESANYFSDPVVSHQWEAGPTTFMFNLDLELGTGYDYYDVVFAVAGKFADGGGLFWAEEHFYLQALILPGDLDRDGDVDLLDLGMFTDCSAGPENSSAPPGCDAGTFNDADLDGDNDVDLGDFAAFQAAFTGAPVSSASAAPGRSQQASMRAHQQQPSGAHTRASGQEHEASVASPIHIK